MSESVNSELARLVEENARAIAGLGRAVAELRKSIAELRPIVEAEREIRHGEVGRLEGHIVEVELLMSLRDWCSAHGLHVERLPRDPYRADAVVEGKALIALIEVAKTGSEADVGQLVEAARIYEALRGERPNALVLYIYAEKPPEELVRECCEHGIIVDNSPKRIALRLAELEEELKAA